MAELSFKLSSTDCDHVFVNDMGDGIVALSQSNERDATERVVMSFDQIQTIYETFAPRYDATKNTDRPLAVLEI